jgi:hypothetical protein
MRAFGWLILALIAPAAFAQTPPASQLKLGPVALALGAPENSTLATIKRHYRLERARGASDTWAVIERDGETVALVTFAQGKLSRASKTWFTSDEYSAGLLAGRLYEMANEFTDAGRNTCTLSAKPYQEGGVKGRIFTLACGPKSIQLSRTRVGKGWATRLQEVLQ